jgi:LacI family transcriptional regulator
MGENHALHSLNSTNHHPANPIVSDSQKSVLLALSRYSATTHMGVARYAAQHGWHLNGEMAITGQIPRGWNGDGIITLLDEREDVADFVRQAKLPVVDLSMMRQDIDVPRVSGDHRAIGRVAGEFFKERGFLHYAWFSAHDDPVSRLREQGFREAVESKALTLQSWFYQTAIRNRGNDWALKSA